MVLNEVPKMLDRPFGVYDRVNDKAVKATRVVDLTPATVFGGEGANEGGKRALVLYGKFGHGRVFQLLQVQDGSRVPDFGYGTCCTYDRLVGSGSVAHDPHFLECAEKWGIEPDVLAQAVIDNAPAD